MKSPASLCTVLLCLLLFGAISCKKKEETITPTPVTPTPVTPTKSSAKDLKTFAFNALTPAVAATIDATAKTIKAEVPTGTDLTKLVPTLAVSEKATVSPATGVVQDFSKAVTYTVTAEDGSTQAYTVSVTVGKSSSTAKDYLFFGTETGGLQAFDAATGMKLWTYAANKFQISTDPYLLDETIYFGSGEKKMYALDARTGAKKWEFQTADVIRSSPVVENGTLYFGGNGLDKKVYALDAASGTKKWEFAIGSSAQASPTVVGGVVYITSYGDKMLFALDAASGAVKWKYPTSDLKNGVCVSNGLVYVQDNNNKGLLALEADKGTVKWRFAASGTINNSPTVINGFVYAASYDGILYALDAKTGDKKWEYKTKFDAHFESSPIGANGVIYVVGSDSFLHAIDATTGAKKWSAAKFPAYSSPIVTDDGIVYATGSELNGKYTPAIYALDAATGAIKLTISGGTYSSPDWNPIT
ncbi:MAG: DUF5018 domain-containing protein, partial [Sphingobacteriales bacterium]